MPNPDSRPPAPRYAPSMTAEYGRVSETARAVELFVLPGILAYLDSIRPAVAAMDAGTPFVIAEYGAADGANSSHLFERIVRHLRAMNPALRVRLVYIDIADPAPFEQSWEGSPLAALEGVEAVYLRRSFYGPIPELAGRVHLGFSSTALHWLDTATVGTDFFRHPTGVQPNQLAEDGRRRFAEKWREDWRVFLR